MAQTLLHWELQGIQFSAETLTLLLIKEGSTEFVAFGWIVGSVGQQFIENLLAGNRNIWFERIILDEGYVGISQ